MDFENGVLFDPGYSKYTLAFAQNIDAAYTVLFSLKSSHQRRFKFQTIYPQLLKLLEHTVAFYLGCLLWASFITQNFVNSPKQILDNDYLGLSVDEESMFFEVNYAISYIEKLKKDCKYYLGKTCNLPNDWTEIMSVYKEFLEMNNFFVDAKTTSDVKLPAQIKTLSEHELKTILEKIEEVINTGEFKDLFSIKNLIF